MNKNIFLILFFSVYAFASHVTFTNSLEYVPPYGGKYPSAKLNSPLCVESIVRLVINMNVCTEISSLIDLITILNARDISRFDGLHLHDGTKTLLVINGPRNFEKTYMSVLLLGCSQ